MLKWAKQRIKDTAFLAWLISQGEELTICLPTGDRIPTGNVHAGYIFTKKKKKKPYKNGGL
jgi:hypothetical protein